MGRSKAKGRGGKAGSKGGSKPGDDRDDPNQKKVTMVETFTKRATGNVGFEAYYKEQGFIPENEWEDFMEALRRELPTTFRVTGSRAHAQSINDHITDTFGPMLQNVILDGEKQPEPKKLEWYPDHLAWQLNVPKRTIRKSPEYKVLQQFLVGETEIGNISRQEAVSMIPPLLLDVEPHHYCLDMCAAPGSKTAQIMEALNPHTAPTTGLLIANDADAKRCHMLVHQTGRMPSIGLGVTCNDACQYAVGDASRGLADCDGVTIAAFPTLKLDETRNRNLTFDRILADVPCSGDGTMRKNPDIWKTWTVANGMQLHGVQLRILTRAMQLLRNGGRLVYSTCSFAPAENESVVAAAMNIFPGQFRIVPVADRLNGLKRRAGLSQWKVATQTSEGDLTWHESYTHHLGYMNGFTDSDDLASDEMKQDPVYIKAKEAGAALKETGVAMKAKRWAPTVFAPENAASLGLEHALRLLPHDQDTGGFFVCVLERVPSEKTAKPEDLASTAGVKRAASPSATEINEQSKKAKLEGSAAEPTPEEPIHVGEVKIDLPAPRGEIKQGRSDPNFKEDAFFFINPEDPELKSCIEFFKLSEDFPKDRVFVRNGTGEVSRTMYIANPALKSMIQGNDYSHAHLLSAGIKIFTRQDSRTNPADTYCKWRIPSDGLSTMLPYLKASEIVHANVDDLRMLLEEQYPIIHESDTGLKGSMRDRNQGCAVVTFAANDGKDGRGALHLPLTLPIWKGIGSLSLLIDKKEKGTLSSRTFGKDICNWTGLNKNRKPEQETVSEAEQVKVDVSASPDAEGLVGESTAIAQGEEAAAMEEDLTNAA